MKIIQFFLLSIFCLNIGNLAHLKAGDFSDLDDDMNQQSFTEDDSAMDDEADNQIGSDDNNDGDGNNADSLDQGDNEDTGGNDNGNQNDQADDGDADQDGQASDGTEEVDLAKQKAAKTAAKKTLTAPIKP